MRIPVDTYCKGIQNGKEVRFEYSEVTLKMSALGQFVDAGFRWKYIVDPATRRAIEIMVNVINGESDRILYQLNELGSGITS